MRLVIRQPERDDTGGKPIAEIECEQVPAVGDIVGGRDDSNRPFAGRVQDRLWSLSSVPQHVIIRVG
jgi:hypothetical protein